MKNKKYLKTLNPAPFLRIFTLCKNLYRCLLSHTSKILNIKERCGMKLLGLALCVFGFFIITRTSHASGIVDAVTNPVKTTIEFFSWGVSIVLYILSTIFASILMIGGWVFDWALNLNSTILTNPAVIVGWPIARDITNLGFVLLIIIIAFSTILKIGNFTAEKALPKLIIAALLINFSLLAVGMVLDFCGILTNFFINQGLAGSGGVGVSQAIMGAMKITSILQPPTITDNWSTFGPGMITFITNLFFINIITAITAITMWAMAIMFLARYVMLGMLIILMPLAILAYVIGRGEWSEWVKKFTDYALFAPISSLFIYLAIATASGFETMQLNTQQAATAAPGLAGITANIGSMIMMIAILLFGLGFAEKASGAAGKMGRAMAEGGMKGMLSGGFKMIGGKNLVKRAAELGKNNQNKFIRGLTRPIRQYAGDAKAGMEKYPGIMAGVMSGIDGGKSNTFRMEEEKKFKQREGFIGKAIEDRAKALGWNPTLPPGNATNDAIFTNAKQEVEKHLDSQRDDEKETALEKTKKYFERENNIAQIKKETGATDIEIKDAIQKHLGNINDARRELTIRKKMKDHGAAINTLRISLAAATGTNKAAIQKNIDDLVKRVKALNDQL